MDGTRVPIHGRFVPWLRQTAALAASHGRMNAKSLLLLACGALLGVAACGGSQPAARSASKPSPYASAAPAAASSPSAAPTAATAPAPVATCRKLPVVNDDPAKPAGFLDVTTGKFTPDASARLTSIGGDLVQTAGSPALVGWPSGWPAYSATGRWVPAPAAWVSPDGTRYLYPVYGEQALHVVDVRTGADRVVFRGGRLLPVQWAGDAVYVTDWPTGAQAPMLRVPLADGTLVATSDVPSNSELPSLLTLSDVMGTGWFAAEAANVQPGCTAVVVGDGAVGLLAVLSAKLMGAERIVAMSRHQARQKLAREFGATDIVSERGEEGIARIKELTNGLGAESVLECVGTEESMTQAIRSTRPGGSIGYVGVPHGVQLDGQELFFTHVRLHGGPAPVRRYLPKLIDLVLTGKIHPGKVFDLTLPLAKVADGYRAMDERRAIKVLLQP